MLIIMDLLDVIKAFQLSDLGYDVWLGNSRGNRYSRAHVTYDAIKDYDYWNFA